MIELVGWLGGICFAICAIPQAYKAFKEKHADGVSSSMLFLWTAGEILTIAYVLTSQGIEISSALPLIANYVSNLLSLAVILWYKYCYKKKK